MDTANIQLLCYTNKYSIPQERPFIRTDCYRDSVKNGKCNYIKVLKGLKYVSLCAKLL